jgi:predicted RNase H-like nuclease (RuvC/YqgF family)
MWRPFYDYVRQVLALTQQVEKNTSDLAELNRKVNDLTDVVRELTFEVRRLRENESHERELLTLRLENALLRFERRLPPSTKEDDTAS